jgi:hypothetical protein
MQETSLFVFRLRSWREAIYLHHICQCLLKVDLKILQQTVAKVENQAMNDGIAVLLVALLNSSSLDDVSAGLDDVQLNESIVPHISIRNLVELFLMQAIDITNVSKPGIQKSQVRGSESCLDPSTIVVPTNDNVLHVQMPYRVIDYGHNTEVGIGDEVGDVAMDENFAGL